MQPDIKLDPSWLKIIADEFEKPNLNQLKTFLNEQKNAGKAIYPKGSQIFNALNSTPFEKVKVVILGQDPYHGPGQAMGLSFSVPDGIAFPPSLQNIFKELATDVSTTKPKSGNLKAWARQGVLLLNATLTVESGNAGSHQKKGWEEFTDRIIQELNDRRENLVFIFWGAYAQKKGIIIDRKKHLVLESAHPSPLSSHRGFFGSRPFSQTNTYLKKHEITPINWQIP